MEYLDQPFEVSTGSGRRPTPVIFEHLRKYSPLELLYQRLASQADITNVNQILEETANFYISNEISRVVAQLIGQLDPGFITIRGTPGGALHVWPAGGSEDGKIDIKVEDGDNETLGKIADVLVAAGAAGTISAKLRRLTQGLEDLKSLVVLAQGDNLIGKVQIEGISQAKQTAKIEIPSAGTYSITATAPTGSYHICSIMFTVSDEVNVTLRDETAVRSGPMDFGATYEPRGLAHNFGSVPLKCATGKKFQITTVGAGLVNGIITYYDA